MKGRERLLAIDMCLPAPFPLTESRTHLHAPVTAIPYSFIHAALRSYYSAARHGGRMRSIRRQKDLTTERMEYAIKAWVTDVRARTFVFARQKTMYGGKSIAVGDTLFIFASENEGGPGLIAHGVVTTVRSRTRSWGFPSRWRRSFATTSRRDTRLRACIRLSESAGRRRTDNLGSQADFAAGGRSAAKRRGAVSLRADSILSITEYAPKKAFPIRTGCYHPACRRPGVSRSARSRAGSIA